MLPPLVLFVSKPIAPPFHDGTKCLVRDVALHLRRHRAEVMTTSGTNDLGYSPDAAHPGVQFSPVYGAAGSFTPTLAANARAAAFLIARSRADLWHFTFAPNPRTCGVGRIARTLRRVPVVQTVASAPRHYSRELFFGDVVVAQSRSTHDQIVGAFAGRPLPRLEIIPPPVGPLRTPSPDEVTALRAELRLPEGAPVFVYPGDLEVSRGAETVARAVPVIAERLPSAIVVFACRAKTKRAPLIAAELAARLDPTRVRFAGETNLLALFGAASGVLFPVDDLWGKVDIPIALLEAMRLGVPIVALSEGPLADLDGVARMRPGDHVELGRLAVELAKNAAFRDSLVGDAQDAIRRRFDAPVVAARYELLYENLTRSSRSRKTG